MNFDNIDKSDGIVRVLNPNYSKSKKHPSPKVLNLTEPGDIAKHDVTLNQLYQNSEVGRDISLDYLGDKANKLEHYGVTPNAAMKSPEDVDETLAEAQGNLAKFGSALSQSIVSEVGLGTVRGAADLLDFIGHAITLNLKDNDYTNPVSQKIQEWQDYFNNEVAPIYTDPNVDISNGGLTNFGWWASNMPSIMSSLTLLIPSTGVTKGLQWLAKASAASKIGTATRNGMKALIGIDKALSKTGGKLNKWQEIGKTIIDAPINGIGERTGRFLENGMNAALSRTMENYQEGQGVYQDVYNSSIEKLNAMSPQEFTEFVNQNRDLYNEAGDDSASKEDIAKKIASKAANQDFIQNYVNIVSDVVQMYGLRNAWKGLKNGETSFTLREAARKAQRNLGKTAEEIAELDAKEHWYSNLGKNILGRIKDEKTIVAGELGEGVEEAVNYIAQQEGTHLGNTYFDKDEAKSTFDNRLQKYFQNAGLLESAFWGTMGGVVFHHLGSGFNRISQTIKDREAKKVNETTGETKPTTPFSISESGEIQARKADIESWNNKIENYWKQIDDINQGKNPFSLNEDDVNLDSDVAKENAAQQAYDELITNMTLQAGHNGNLDMLKEYMASDEVRKAMIDKGMVDNKYSKYDQEKALRKINEVTESYETELKGLVNLAEATRVTQHTNDILPIEYLQSIAGTNVLLKQKNSKIDSQIRSLDKQIQAAMDNEDVHEILGDEHTQKEYQFVASKALITQQLRLLQAEKAKLLDDKENINNISNKVAIENIDRTIKEYHKQLDANTLRYAVLEQMRASYESDGKTLGSTNTKASTRLEDILSGKYDDVTIIKELKKYAKDYGISSKLAKFDSDTDILGQVNSYGKTLSDLSTAINKTNEIKLDGVDGTLSSLLINRSALEMRKAYNNGQIIKDAKTLSKEVSFLNNTINEARRKAIDNAYSSITQLSDKYDENKYASKIAQAIGASYRNSKRDMNVILSFMSDGDKAKFKDALTVLNLSKGDNYALGQTIQDMLAQRQAIFDSQERNNSHDENDIENDNGAEPIQQSQNTSSDAPQSPQSPSVDNLSGTPFESPTAQAKSVEENLQPQDTSQNLINESGQRVQDFLNNSNSVTPEITGGNIDDGFTYKLNGEVTDASFTNNPDLFENPSDNAESIEVAPTYTLDDNNLPVVTKGKLKVDETKLEEVTPTIPFTGRDASAASETSGSKPNISDTSNGITYDDLVSNLIKSTSTKHMRRLRSKEITINDLRNELTKEGQALNASDEDIKQAVDKAVNMAEVLGKKLGFASYAAEVVLQGTNNTKNNFVDAYKEAAKQMLKSYASNKKLRQKNGKWYGKLEDLLRYVNENTPNGGYADLIYSNLKEYLKTDEGYKTFVMTDSDNVDDYSFVENYHKSAAERQAERANAIEAGTLKRVNIHNLNEVVPDEDIEKVNKELNNLKVGDKLTIKQGTKVNADTKVLLVQHNGITIGWLGLPSINPHTGNYEQVNDGWKYQVSRDGSNDGELKDWLKSIANSEGEEQSKLNNILYKIAFERKPIKDYVSEFSKLNIIKESKDKGNLVINEDAGFTYEKALNGLVKLWRYNLEVPYAEDIADSIDTYYDMLRKSYDTATNLVNTNQEITVSKASKGEILRIANGAGEAINVAIPASGAIAPNTDARIAVAKANSNVEISGRGFNTAGFVMNQTLVAIDNGNGTTDYVNAYPVRVGNTTYLVDGKPKTLGSSKVVQEFNKALKAQLEARFKDINSLDDWNNFREFLCKLFDYKNYNTLYTARGSVFRANNGMIYINLDQNHSIGLYRAGRDGNQASQIVLTSKDANGNRNDTKLTYKSEPKHSADEIIKFIEDNAFVNFDQGLLNFDNNKDISLNGFFRKSDDGKLELYLPDYKDAKGFSYKANSYNDFMLKNDLLRLDLKQENGSNYRRIAIDNPNANSTLEFSIGEVNIADTNAKENIPPRKREDVVPSFTDDIKTITNSDSNHQGIDIATRALGEDFAKELKDNKVLSNILPNKVIFANDRLDKFREDEKNSDIDAMFDNKTKEVVIGDSFINLAPDRMIKVLIHENLHARLDKYGKARHARAIANMKGIYDEFVNAITQDIKDINEGKLDEVSKRRGVDAKVNGNFFNNIDTFRFQEYLDKGQEQRAIEEFLVESLTNEGLVQYLNRVQVNDVGETSNKKTIWQKIMEFVSKLFGFEDVEASSLREKEFNQLAKILTETQSNNSATVSNITQQDSNNQVEETKVEETPEVEEQRDIQIDNIVKDEIESESDFNLDDDFTADANDDLDIDTNGLFDDLGLAHKSKDVTLKSNSYPSVQSAINSLPLSQQSKFANLLSSGDIEISCM